MIVSSHIALGVASWTALCRGEGLPLAEVDLLWAAVGALLPDLDHPSSWVGRRLRLVSVPVRLLFGHRGLTHSLLAAAGGLALLHWQGLDGKAAPLVVGYLSHLAGDACTPSGVPLLWPARRCYSLKLFQTGGLIEHTVILLVMVTTAWAWGWV
jgi:inner membrane protein